MPLLKDRIPQTMEFCLSYCQLLHCNKLSFHAYSASPDSSNFLQIAVGRWEGPKTNFERRTKNADCALAAVAFAILISVTQKRRQRNSQEIPPKPRGGLLHTSAKVRGFSISAFSIYRKRKEAQNARGFGSWKQRTSTVSIKKQNVIFVWIFRKWKRLSQFPAHSFALPVTKELDCEERAKEVTFELINTSLCPIFPKSWIFSFQQ